MHNHGALTALHRAAYYRAPRATIAKQCCCAARGFVTHGLTEPHMTLHRPELQYRRVRLSVTRGARGLLNPHVRGGLRELDPASDGYDSITVPCSVPLRYTEEIDNYKSAKCVAKNRRTVYRPPGHQVGYAPRPSRRCCGGERTGE